MIDVTCAIIRNDENEVLIVQRGDKSDHPFKWEFPGGKLDKDETEEECIIREIREELSMDIVTCRRMQDTEFDYGIKQIRLIPFICDTLDELPVLYEHISYRWVEAGELKNIDFSEADIIVAENYLRDTAPAERQSPAGSSENPEPVEADLRTMVGSMMGAKEAEWVAMSAVENEAILKKLQEYSFSDDRKLAFRASWTLSKVFDKYPGLINQSLTKMIETLDSVDNESVRRSFLRMVSLSEIDKLSQKHHGILADCCFRYLLSADSAIAIKAYSMEIIYKLAVIYPELAKELSSAISMLDEDAPAGVTARGRMILKKLAGLTKDH